MYEIANLVNMRGALGLHIIKYPAGTYGFSGNVPLSLAYEGPAEDIEKGRKFGFGLVKTVRHLSWPTADSAWEAAENAGYARCASPGCACNS